MNDPHLAHVYPVKKVTPGYVPNNPLHEMSDHEDAPQHLHARTIHNKVNHLYGADAEVPPTAGQTDLPTATLYMIFFASGSFFR